MHLGKERRILGGCMKKVDFAEGIGGAGSGSGHLEEAVS